MSAAHIRNAEIGDLPTIRALYAHHVEHSLGTFEEIAPTLEEMTRRWQSVTNAGLPYLACEVGGAVVGYCYAGLYRPRHAYRFSVEDSVYVSPDHARRGFGRLLLSALIDRCTLLGYRQMIAVIGDDCVRLSEAFAAGTATSGMCRACYDAINVSGSDCRAAETTCFGGGARTAAGRTGGRRHQVEVSGATRGLLSLR